MPSDRPWLDSLSEDWVSQPRSNPGSLNTVAHSRSSMVSGRNSTRRSQLPRSRSSSNASRPLFKIPDREPRDSTASERRKSVLSERSLSEDNILSGSFAEDTESRTTQIRIQSRTISDGSCGSVIRHEAESGEHPGNADPLRPKGQGTLDWRRRLLQGQMGYEERKDLFSPMGLENIFQRPRDMPKSQQAERRGLPLLKKGLETIPSSPPPWPSSISIDQAAEDTSALGQNVRDLENSSEENSEASLLQRGERFPSRQRASPGASVGLPSLDTNPSDIRLSVNKRPRDACPAGADPPRIAVTGTSSQEDDSQRMSDDAFLDNTRHTSGQTEIHNEDFSPVFISKLNTADGRVDYAAIDLTKAQLERRMRGFPAKDQDNSIFSEAKVDSSEARISDLQEVSLPGDLPAGTPEHHEIGDFVTTQRGGFSADSSFRRRSLSDAPTSNDDSQLYGIVKRHHRSKQSADNSLLLAGQRTPPSALSPRSAPVTPAHRRDDAKGSRERDRSSGSPLKLFGDHDTFTSNRLFRRMSQLEEPSQLDDDVPLNRLKATSPNKRAARDETAALRLSSVEEMSTKGHSPMPQHTPLALRNFGSGTLDAHDFPDTLDFPGPASTSSASPASDVDPPGARGQFKFLPNGSPQLLKDRPHRKTGPSHVAPHDFSKRNSSGATNVFRAEPQTPARVVKSNLNTKDDGDELAEGKRPAASPAKSPTPKRRRTSLHSEDGDGSCVDTDGAKDAHQKIQAVIGKKRKDARNGNDNNTAQPEVLLKRHILRPRNPTPSQRRQEAISQGIRDVTEAFLSSSPGQRAFVDNQAAVDPNTGAPNTERATAVAIEIAAFNERTSGHMVDNSRKRSVTTQDFLDEAMKIMDYIRNKDKPLSGLGSLQESEIEHEAPIEISSLTVDDLSFSRPPSREGPRWRDPNSLPITDPAVQSRLEKFQERADEDFVASAFAMNSSGPVHQQVEMLGTSPQQNGNVHVIPRINTDDEQPAQYEELPDNAKQGHTINTNTSTNSSLGHTAITSASKKSDNVATLAPSAVAHLIPQQVADMFFDKDQGAWLKTKRKRDVRSSFAETSAMTSEEDPFRDIPDLEVDEANELCRPQPVHGMPLEATGPRHVPQAPLQQATTVYESGLRPQTREGAEPPFVSTSSVPSKFSIWGSSQAQVETRATSWSVAEALRRSKAEDYAHTQQHGYYECSDLNNFTNGFVQSEDQRPQTTLTALGEESRVLAGGDSEAPKAGETTARDGPASTHEMQTASPPQIPLNAPSQLLVQPVDEADDQTEQQMERRELADDLAPLPVLQSQTLTMSKGSPYRLADPTFILSDLPSFTVDQIDEREIPSRTVLRRHGQGTIKTTEDRYHQGSVELVKALQDVESEEPYWDELRQVNLRQKSITSLHLLGDLCPLAEEVDVSENRLAHTAGVPSTVRSLNIARNLLDSLTNWAHLVNLQYLDVSHNDIDSLEPFGCLYHLRQLKADGNKIESLDPVFHMDGLLSLSVASNNIQAINFTDCVLKRLTQLDACSNQIRSVEGLEWLPELTSLELASNALESFPDQRQAFGSSMKISLLNLSDNPLSLVELKDRFPVLKELHLDGCHLPHVDGLASLRYLSVLSARQQTITPRSADVSGMLANSEVFDLRLSATSIVDLELPHVFPNLQRLELASCGLDTLPTDFGRLAPNLRHLNLNFNAIKDLRPLTSIRKVKTLLLAGNRLDRLRRSAAAICAIGTELETLDLRDNPLTIGFYYPAAANPTRKVSQLALMARNDATQRDSADDSQEPHTLPPNDFASDSQYLARLDGGTQLRRRVFEILLATKCSSLAYVDGLVWSSEAVLQHDAVWSRLVELGIVKKCSAETRRAMEGQKDLGQDPMRRRQLCT